MYSLSTNHTLTPAFLRSTIYLPGNKPVIAKVARLCARVLGITVLPGQRYWFIQSSEAGYYYLLTFNGSAWCFSGNARIAPEYIKQVRYMTGDEGERTPTQSPLNEASVLQEAEKHLRATRHATPAYQHPNPRVAAMEAKLRTCGLMR